MTVRIRYLVLLSFAILPATTIAGPVPHLTYSTFLVGSDRLWPRAVALDSYGDTYIAGQTSNAFDLGFVAKVNPTGTKVLWIVTFPAILNALAADPLGNVYVTGTTPFRTLTLLHPAQAHVGSGNKAVVIKMDTLGRVLYSTYLGGVGSGAGSDAGLGIAVTRSGQVLVGGQTSSTDFPVTGHAFQHSAHLCAGPVPGLPSNCSHGFLARLSTSGSHILYATYVGGNGVDAVTSVAATSDGGTLLAGHTTSHNIPVTVHVHDPLGPSGPDFLLKLGRGGRLNWSTRGLRHPGAIAGQWSGHIVVADGPAVAVLDATGHLTRVVRVGKGIGAPWITSVALDGSGDIYATGFLAARTLHAVHAYQPHLAGGRDAFVVRIVHLRSLAYSSYLGGSGDDEGTSVAASDPADVTVTGITNSDDFPLRHALMAHANQPCGDGTCTVGFLSRFGS